MFKFHQSKTKIGAASIYVVLFTTLLLGIITVSFIRLMTSGSRRTANMDLSQSAYDSAVAGIEDAKIALLKYHECISQGYSANKNGNSCEKIIYIIRTSIENQDCDGVSDALNRFKSTDKATVVREAKGAGKDKNADDMKQAYTCIKISEETPDYRSTLSQDNRTRIVPIRSSSLDQINNIKVSWFSKENQNKTPAKYMPSSSKFSQKSNFAPPVVAFQFFQNKQHFSLDQAVISQGIRSNRGLLVLKPIKGSGNNNISLNSAVKSNDKASTNNSHEIRCNDSASGDFFCHATISLPEPIGGKPLNVGSSFIRLSLPYGEPDTDFSISLCGDTGCHNIYGFAGVQAMVDSTGRANDLYRRIESRIEMVDIFYPYPEFAIEMQGGSGDNSIKKNFWVTRNCWESDNGDTSSCNNNGEL